MHVSFGMRLGGARSRVAVATTVTAALVAVTIGGSIGMVGALPRPTATRATADPGITKTEIRVGGVASVTNPLNGPYDSSFDGVQAYFNMVNSKGGVHGRKLKLVAKRDDKIAANAQEIQGVVEQDKVFAVLPNATIFAFSGAKYLAEKKIPTFGWGINSEWSKAPNFYGFGGQACLDCPSTGYPMTVKLTGRKTVGVLAYGVANSSDCANLQKVAFEKYPTAKVAYLNTSLAFGQVDFSAEVKAMKDAGVTVITHCIDQNAALALAKEIKRQSLNAIQIMPNAYDQEFMKVNAQFFTGSLIRITFTPFEFKPKPKGMVEFNTWMGKAKYKKNEMAMVGWLSAYVFVQGLKAAGPNVTRASLIAALNAPKFRTDRAKGLLPGTDTVNHTGTQKQDCYAVVEVTKTGALRPWKTKPGKPFLCWPFQPETTPTKTSHR